MATTLASLVVRIGADVRGVTAGLRTLDRRMKSSEAASARIARAYRTVVAGSALYAARQVFELGASVEETGSKFRTVFGESSGEMQRFIDDFGNLAGLSGRQAQEMTASIGGVAQAFGFATQESAAFAEQSTRLAADLASFHNAAGGTNEVLGAMKSAFVGEFEPMKRFDVVLRQIDVNQRALAATGKKVVSELTQEEKALATLSLITERAGVAVGDLARTQDSAANRAKRLSAQFRDIREAIAVSLLPVFNVVMREIEGMLGGTATFIEWLKTSAPVMTAWAEVGVAAFKAVASALALPVRLAFDLGMQLGNVGRAMVALIQQDWAAFHTIANEIEQTWSDMGKSFVDVGDNVIELYDRLRIAMETFGATTVNIVNPSLDSTEQSAAAAASEMERLLAALSKYNAASGLLGGLSRIPGLGFLGGLSGFAGTLGGVLNPLAGVAGAFGFGGGKASGGPVSGGTAYMVGERGPEMFVPSQSGTIIPNGGVSINVSVTAPRNGSEAMRDREWMRSLQMGADALRSNGYSFA